MPSDAPGPGSYEPIGATVEIIDGMDGIESSGFLMPDRVLVNGTDIGMIAEGGLRIDPGDRGKPTTVTITLVPTRIEIKPARGFTVVDGRILKGE